MARAFARPFTLSSVAVRPASSSSKASQVGGAAHPAHFPDVPAAGFGSGSRDEPLPDASGRADMRGSGKPPSRRRSTSGRGSVDAARFRPPRSHRRAAPPGILPAGAPSPPRSGDEGTTTSIRPASDSLTVGTRRMLADPVSRKRPYRRFRSTEILIARSRSGARWTSSIVTNSGRPATNPSGSSWAVR